VQSEPAAPSLRYAAATHVREANRTAFEAPVLHCFPVFLPFQPGVTLPPSPLRARDFGFCWNLGVELSMPEHPHLAFGLIDYTALVRMAKEGHELAQLLAPHRIVRHRRTPLTTHPLHPQPLRGAHGGATRAPGPGGTPHCDHAARRALRLRSPPRPSLWALREPCGEGPPGSGTPSSARHDRGGMCRDWHSLRA
jgi:hypothetical protein